MLSKNKSIAVMFSYEMLPVLHSKGFKNVTLLIDKPRKSIYNIVAKYGYKVLKLEEVDMKFDVIIGNPPYQETKNSGDRKDQASNLWSKFWTKSFDLTKGKGIVALITPTSWLSPSSDLKGENKINGHTRLWNVFNNYTSLANVKDVSKYFPNIGSSFGYVIVNKSGNEGLKFTDGSDTSLGFLPKSNFETVSKQLSRTNNIGSTFIVNQSNTSDMRVCIPMTRKLTAGSIEILKDEGIPTGGSEKDNLYIYIHVNTKKQAKYVQSRVRSCLDILNTDCRWSGFVNIQIVKMIDMSKHDLIRIYDESKANAI